MAMRVKALKEALRKMAIAEERPLQVKGIKVKAHACPAPLKARAVRLGKKNQVRAGTR